MIAALLDVLLGVILVGAIAIVIPILAGFAYAIYEVFFRDDDL